MHFGREGSTDDRDNGSVKRSAWIRRSLSIERFQKFVHIENFVNSIYKSFKFIIATYNDDDTLPGKLFLTITSHFEHFLSNDHFYNRKFTIWILTSYRSWVRNSPYNFFKCITIYLGAKWIWALSAMLKLKFRKSKLKMKLTH